LLIFRGSIELGAGGGLVGLAVARGCVVGPSPIYLTDQEPMLPLMETNIKLNNLSPLVKAMVLNWGEPLPDNIPSHPAVILAADCVYFEPAFPLLITTLQELIGPDSVCYFCFKRRRRADLRFLKLAKKIFDISEIQDDPDAESYKRENIFLYKMRARNSEADGR
jgi:predicted nicotinamide N-methyase